jgi:hypothetical protein
MNPQCSAGPHLTPCYYGRQFVMCAFIWIRGNGNLVHFHKDKWMNGLVGTLEFYANLFILG